MDLQVCRAAQRLYAIYDSTFQMVHPAQRNYMQQVDLATQRVLRTAHEFSEEYELVCFAPSGAGGDWGNELVAGAVHGSERTFPSSALHHPHGQRCSHAPCGGTARPCLPGFSPWFAPAPAGFCTSCYRSGLPSLCYHKSAAATAALCIFDLRASMHMASGLPLSALLGHAIWLLCTSDLHAACT